MLHLNSWVLNGLIAHDTVSLHFKGTKINLRVNCRMQQVSKWLKSIKLNEQEAP